MSNVPAQICQSLVGCEGCHFFVVPKNVRSVRGGPYLHNDGTWDTSAFRAGIGYTGWYATEEHAEVAIGLAHNNGQLSEEEIDRFLGKEPNIIRMQYRDIDVMLPQQPTFFLNADS